MFPNLGLFYCVSIHAICGRNIVAQEECAYFLSTYSPNRQKFTSQILIKRGIKNVFD